MTTTKHFAKFFTILLLAATILFPYDADAQTYARNGMVSSASKTASQSGVDILKKGGNAIDAAVATAFSLAVTWPFAGNIGGGGFLVYMDANGSSTTFDFREKAPMAATPDMFLDENGELIENLNHLSMLAIGVPGTVAGLWQAHQKYGKLDWQEVVQPSIDLAENGFEFDWTLYFHSKNIKENWGDYPEMQRYMLKPDGSLHEPGELWKQPALANTLKQIREGGADAFYKGDIAKKIAKFMKDNGGIITKKDLANYEAVERVPLKGKYKDYDIVTMPPPSSGGVSLIQMMNMMENFDLEEVEFGSAEYVHILAEVMRRAFANRAEHLGDPDFNPDMPIDELISKEYAEDLTDRMDMKSASVSDSSRFSQLYDGESTTHFSVLDKDGNAVSLTYTLEYGYGSRMVIEELGFIFNNEMGDFNPKPGYTNSKGMIGTPPNQIAPGKRMLSSMTPAIIAKDGKPYLVIGSPGGRTIINTVFQATLNVLGYDMRIDRAIESLKIHHQWLPDQIYYETLKMSPDTRDILMGMGHKMVPREQIGVLMGIVYDAEQGIMIGASDSARPDGAAIGY